MACDRQTVLLISVLADGEATPEEAILAREHLAECGECRATYEQWQSQREMFEWAYNAELPEAARVDWSAEANAKGTLMSTIARVTQRRSCIGWSPRLAWVGALGALMIAAIVIFQLVSRPPVLQVGKSIAAGSSSQYVRMEGGVQLRVGPNSKVSRVDDRTIRLEQGWVNASVRHGTGLRVLTRRMEVVDQGTVFRVGSGAELDYVIVEEGAVRVERGECIREVKAGHFLMAHDEGEPSVAAMIPESEVEEGRLLTSDISDSLPASADSLDWEEALNRLAARFPDARTAGSSTWGDTEGYGMAFRLGVGQMTGVKRGLREHFAEIAEGMTGGRVDCDDWKIPVALLLVSGVVSSPQLPGDIYLVSLVCRGGELAWLLVGADGSEAEYPVGVGGSEGDKPGFSGGESTIESLQVTRSVAHKSKEAEPYMAMSMRLTDWPGSLKPQLRLKIAGVPVSDSKHDQQALTAKVASLVPMSAGVDIGRSQTDLLYLDADRKHRLLITWNAKAAEGLCALWDQAKRGRSGSVVLAALWTNAELAVPEADSGVYLLRLVQPGGSVAGRIELATVDGSKVVQRNASPLTLRDVEKKGSSTWSLSPDCRNGQMQFVRRAGLAGPDFGFRFSVTGGPGVPWDKERAAGTMRIRRP